jgi:hypothetical protein
MATSYNFSNVSGYKWTLDILKVQIKAISDDTPDFIFTDNNIFDYTHNLSSALSQQNFPLCILKVANEEMKSDYNQNSDLVIEMYHVFNNQDKDFYITLNQIISTFRSEFANTYSNRFKIESINRDESPSELSDLSKYKPFWTVKYTLLNNNIKY